MTKDSIIKARKDFSGNPIRIICDNMIIIWDKADKNAVVIWDDENERLISFRIDGDNTSTNLQQRFPFSIIYTDYELIQYMEIYARPMDAINWANAYKSQLKGDYDRVINIVKNVRAMQGGGYSGGSIVNPDLKR